MSLLESSKSMLAEPDGQRRRNQLLLDFLIVSPFLYDADGIFTGNQNYTAAVNELDGNTLENAYKDLFDLHLSPLIMAGFEFDGFVQQLISRYSSQFLSKELLPGLRKQVSQDSSESPISLEEVPPLVALFRGALGYDCSMLSVPLYVLHPDVRVFFLREGSNFNKAPIGYVLTLEVTDDDQRRPAILTVNGAKLSAKQVRAAALGINALYGQTSSILVSKASAIVNTSTSKEGLWYDEVQRTERATVKLPENWMQVSAAWRSRRQYTDYYSKRALEGTFFKIALNPSEQEQMRTLTRQKSELHYHVDQNQEQISRINKLLLAIDFPPAAKVFGLDRQTKHAGQALAQLQDGFEFTATGISAVARNLNLSLPQLLKLLPMKVRFDAFQKLRVALPEIQDSVEMREVINDMNNYLNEQIARMRPTRAEELFTWQMIRQMGRGKEMWADFYNKTKEIQPDIIKDVFPMEALSKSDGESLLKQAIAVLGTRSVRIFDYNIRYKDLVDWPEHVWRWAAEASSYPFEVMNQMYTENAYSVWALNDFMIKQIRYKNPPRWLLSELIAGFPKDYLNRLDPDSLGDARYYFKVCQLVRLLWRYMDVATDKEIDSAAKLLVDIQLKNPKFWQYKIADWEIADILIGLFSVRSGMLSVKLG